MQSKHILIVLSTVCALVLIPSIGLADTITWVGTAGGGDNLNWHDPLNWDPPQRPLADDDVIITTPSKTFQLVVIQTFGQEDDAACDTLDLSVGVTLHIKGVG